MALITDMHCHILPGLDDGSLTMEETLDTLREAKRQQIDRLIVTPHFHPQRYVVKAGDIHHAVRLVREACAQEGIGIAMYEWQECYYYSGLVEQLDTGQALTLCGTRFVLVEFDPDVPYSFLQNGLHTLRQSGYVPIIAHFERYECLYNERHFAEIRHQQFLLQMNFDTLLGRRGLFGESRWQKLVRKGMVDYLGSDCHGTHFRPLQVDKAMRWIEKKVDPSVQTRMLKSNVDRIIFG